MKCFVNGKLVFPDRITEGAILVDHGKIIASGDVAVPVNAERIDLDGAYVGPGLFDIHVHGYAAEGLDGPHYSAWGDPANMALCHLKSGTTSITPSVSYSNTLEDYLSCVEKIRPLLREGKTSIVGIHFEGPFTNPQFGASSHSAWTYSRELCEKIFDAAGEDVLHCTYAPELAHAEEFELFLRERGVVADIGHTSLTPAEAQRAVKNGARIVTHLFDAMGCHAGYASVDTTGVLQESADAVTLACDGLYYELICDSRGIHVKPSNARMAYRCAGEDCIILVTDSVPGATHNPADYPADSPMSAPDLNYNAAGELSGSRCLLSDCCRNFMRFTGADIRVAFKCAATNPAKALGLDGRIGSILAGRDANLLVVRDDFRVESVYFRGMRV